MASERGIVGRLWLGGRFRRGWLTWSRGRLERVAAGAPPRAHSGTLLDLGDARVLPGFVDTLAHGFGGVGCVDGGAAALARMARGMAAAGVTSAYGGFYPAPLPVLRRAVKAWNGLKAAGGGPRARLLGWHVEGIFVAPGMRGALPRAGIARPDAAAARRFLDACGGWLRMSTIAPELPGAIEAAAVLRAAGVRPSIGHSAASWADCVALAAGGPVAITHLGNRMPPLHVRAPGPIGFTFAGRAQWVGVIPDGQHVVAEALGMLAAQPTLRHRLMFQSDNLSHAGLAAEEFRAGGQRLHREGPAARNARGGLAGTLDPLPEMLLQRVAAGDLTWAQAVRGGCEVPGALVGDCGRLAAGLRADLVVIDAAATAVETTWVGGRRV
ncbi:MAG TPA: hypothetical protein VGC54_11415 [Planctomycetota bacterium]